MIYVAGRWKLYEPADVDHGPVTSQLVTATGFTPVELSQRWRLNMKTLPLQFLEITWE